jgi:hypothetical protein
MERIHVVGAGPRTGTTLLAECRVSCFAIDAFEPHEASLCRHKKNVGVYLTKNPVDLHIVSPRLLIDRHLHVIAMLRDPRDVIVSRHRNDPKRYWAPLRFWKRHARVIRRLRHHRRFILLRYEDLVRSPDAVQDALTARMPFLKQRARFSDFHKLARPSAKSVAAMGSVRPIDSASIGNWRNHLARVAGQIAIHGPISEELIAFGYEPDESWLAALEGVSPTLRRAIGRRASFGRYGEPGIPDISKRRRLPRRVSSVRRWCERCEPGARRPSFALFRNRP